MARKRKRVTMIIPTSVRLTRPIYAAVKAKAVEQGCSMSYVIVAILDKWRAFHEAGEKHRQRMKQD